MLPGFRTFSEDFYSQCQELCLQVMVCFEVACRLPPGSLVDRCKPAASELRYNHYPAISLRELHQGHTRRGWPHTDFGLITLLFQDTEGGLEYEDRSRKGNFIPLERKAPDEIAINISDTMQRLSNDYITSGIHQVWVPQHVAQGDMGLDEKMLPERKSAVFFFKAHWESQVGPLQQFVPSGEASKYPDVTALEFHKSMTSVLIENAGNFLQAT